MTTVRGITNFITIGGTDLDGYNPAEIRPRIDELATDVDTKGDSTRFWPYVLAGLPDKLDRYTFELPWPTKKDATHLRAIRRFQATAGSISLAIWKPINVYYTATDGQTTFYLPRRRQNAPSALSKSTTTFPLSVWIDGSAVSTIAYAAGPTVSTPAAGTCNVSQSAHTSGNYEGYVEFRLAAQSAGAVIEVEFYPLFICRVLSRTENYPGSFQEERGLVLQER